jgi:hypothetical protein
MDGEKNKEQGVEVNVDHMVKQRKRKDLSNDYVYCSIDGVVEMFPIGLVTLSKHGGKSLNVIIQDFKDEIEKLNKRLDTNKAVTKSLFDKIEKIEGKMEKYGLH